MSLPPSADGEPALPPVPPMPGAWTLEQALEWLEGHVNMEVQAPNRVAVPSLDAMRELSALAGDPQHAAPVIHVTGTNGKGSTARTVASTAMSANHRNAASVKMSKRLGRWPLRRSSAAMAESTSVSDSSSMGRSLREIRSLSRSRSGLV